MTELEIRLQEENQNLRNLLEKVNRKASKLSQDIFKTKSIFNQLSDDSSRSLRIDGTVRPISPPQWIQTLERSTLMDKQWYAAIYHVDPEDAIVHYITIGHLLGYDPSPFFSTSDYYEKYEDVKNANIPALVHYERDGQREGREIKKAADATLNLWKGCSKSGLSRAPFSPESAWHPRKPVCKLVAKAKTFDVVSFDIFDTLILRNVHKCTDIFRIIEADFGIPFFERQRLDAEKRCHKIYGDEATIFQIYDELSKCINLDVNAAIEREFEYECKFCVANPYMMEVFEQLIQAGKKVIIVSDMYWPAGYLERLLKHVGYHGWSELFVSCDCDCGKHDSLLQEYVWDIIGRDKSVLHIGDNKISDVKASVITGWNVEWYENCFDKSSIFYEPDSNSIPSSIRTGICCNRLNNGKQVFSKEYEHGFLYGGIIACGFCDFIDHFAAQHEDEMIWFLARDMDIIHRIYQENFNTLESKYVVVSRAAATKLNIREFPGRYYQYFFKNYMENGTLKIGKILQEVGLDVLIPFLFEEGLNVKQIFSEKNYDALHRLYQNHIDEVCEAMSDTVEGAKRYFNSMLDGKKKICVVDLGWNGTIMIELKRFFKSYFPDVQLDCALIGASNTHITTDMISVGDLSSFAFSTLENTNLCLEDGTFKGTMKVMCMEAMFSSIQPTLLSYGLDRHGQPVLNYGDQTEEDWLIKDMQTGMRDFACEYYAQVRKCARKFKLSPVDAFGPYMTVCDDFQYLYLLFSHVKEYEDRVAVSGDKARLTTLGNIMESNKLL